MISCKDTTVRLINYICSSLRAMYRITILLLIIMPVLLSMSASKDSEIVYRVIIYEGTREGANEAKAAFEAKHPEVKAFFTFQTPKFVIEVGDYKSKGKAKKFRNSIFEEYPRCIVVKRKSKLIMVGGG